jgi:site-specific DNA-methyltransferase (adenine-specific)
MQEIVRSYMNTKEIDPLFLIGDSLDVLKAFPDNSIDCSITSPPYYMKREYLSGGIGLEETAFDYIDALVAICEEVYRVLKPTGSFWLNIGDSYISKQLMMIPQRVAIKLTDKVGFTLRNQVVWNKLKGAPDNAKDKMRTLWEPIFFFTKEPRGYYYDVDAVRKQPRKAKVKNGAVISATGVSGVRYKRKIELSTDLTEEEKENAFKALEDMLHQVEIGEVPDFRMVIRGATRTTHGNSQKLSGRAKELADKGFYFLKYSKKGAKISDVWDIIPEDTQGRLTHYAPYPEDLVRNPIALTCPKDGIVLDPFVGTGTTCKVALEMKRKSIGIDIASEYIDIAKKRCANEIQS